MGDRPRRDPRLERLQHNVPSWYVPLHLGVTIGLLGGVSLALLGFMPPGRASWIAWVAAALTILVADLVEYVLHRWPMHRRYRHLAGFFRQHTIAHHRFFTHETMGVVNAREITFVIPSLQVVGASMATLAVVTLAVWLVLGQSAGMLAGGVLGLIGTAKQILHLAFHLPDSWMSYPVLRSRWFQAMKLHHAIHHNPRLMRKWNFNIGVPIFDWIFGTLTWDEDGSPARSRTGTP